MNSARSPLFPQASLALSPARDENPEEEVYIPNLPALPHALLLSVQVFIVPAEQHLFLQGYKPAEYETRPPSLLRGCLVLRILKPARVKSVLLHFKGIQRTEWPEGIPPKRSHYAEVNELINHTWPFYHVDSHTGNFGADFVRPLPLLLQKNQEDISHFSLNDSWQLNQNPVDTAKGFAASLINRATTRGNSPSPAPAITPVTSFQDLTTALSTGSASEANSAATASTPKPGYFMPGDYVYNFEHPLPALSPESVDANFGRVFYALEANIIRTGAFKTNLVARLPVSVVRIPSDNSVEENEPIFIERDWEDQLRYEILVGSKSIVLDTYVPISFKFIPLYGKVALHRIRVSITENCNYYCRNKTVHRAEPTRKFLLLEHKAKQNKSLLSKSGCLTDDGPDIGSEDDEILPRELEFQMFVPSTINKKYNFAMHPDTSFETIQCDHWIKISLRISRKDPSNPEKRKHFEISIDSPIHLCSPYAAHCNTLLPAYDRPEQPEPLPQYAPLSPPMSPDLTAIDQLQGVGHLLFSALHGYSFRPDSPAHSEGSSNRHRGTSRAGTPHLFYHLSNSGEPIEKDHRIHLEANLYSPTENQVDSIGLPQAQPLPCPQSPAHSPSPLVPDNRRRPTVNPPSFEALTSVEGILPPAYEKEDPATSPVRNENTGSSKEFIPSEAPRTVADTGVDSSGIKDMLSRQFDLTHSESQAASGNQENAKPEDAEAHLMRQSRSLRIPETEDDLDLSDINLFKSGPVSPELGPLATRRSSVVLADDVDLPLDQTLPLLTLNEGYTEDNLSTSLFDQGRRPSAIKNTSMADLMDQVTFGHTGVENHFFKNPRLKKHYHEETQSDTANHKERQKSFGVVPSSELPSSGSTERALTSSSARSEIISEVTNSSGDKAHEGFRGSVSKDVNEPVR